MTKVLVVATSRKTRGGITSVVKAHEQGEQWKKYHCKWIETHRDGNALIKILYLIKGSLLFIMFLPFYDIIHFHVSFQGSLKRKYIYNKLAHLLHKKTIVHFHPPTPDVLFDMKNYNMYKNLFGTADIVFVLSSEWKKLIFKQFGIIDNVRVLYNPCPSNAEHLSDDKKTDNRYILFAGTLIERKGYKCLIKAFSELAEKFPNWKLILAGNGEIETAWELAENGGHSSQIELRGWMSKKEMKNLYLGASVYCLASSGEGFPMVVLEAWAYGVPVVTTLVGGLPDVVVEGINALTFEFDSIQQLKEKLTLVMSDSVLRNRLANEGLKLAQNKFDVNTINSQLEDIYEELSKS